MNSLDHKGCGDPQKARETKFSAALPLHRPSPPPRFNTAPQTLPIHQRPPHTIAVHQRRPQLVLTSSTHPPPAWNPSCRDDATIQRIKDPLLPTEIDVCFISCARIFWLGGGILFEWRAEWNEYFLPRRRRQKTENTTNLIGAVASIRTNNTTTNRYKNWGERRSLMKWGMIWGTISTLIVIIEFNYLRCYVYNTLYQ